MILLLNKHFLQEEKIEDLMMEKPGDRPTPIKTDPRMHTVSEVAEEKSFKVRAADLDVIRLFSAADTENLTGNRNRNSTRLLHLSMLNSIFHSFIQIVG